MHQPLDAIGRRSREKSQNRYEGLQKVGEQTLEVMSKFSITQPFRFLMN